MRRSEYAGDTERIAEELLSTEKYGYLGIMTPDGYPRVVPVNFVADGTTIFFHGAGEGEKYDAVQANSRVTFTVDRPYSLIPSYWLAIDYACPATTFFKSVQINGTIRVLDDAYEKASALNLFMEKMQPEGGYKPIDADLKMYKAALRETQVFRIDATRVTAKSKFAQNKPERVRRDLIARLRERGEPIDLLTADEIALTLEAPPQGDDKKNPRQ